MRSCACPRTPSRPSCSPSPHPRFFVGLLLHLWWLALAGVVVVALAVLIWLWPEQRLRQRVETQHV